MTRLSAGDRESHYEQPPLLTSQHSIHLSPSYDKRFFSTSQIRIRTKYIYSDTYVNCRR